MNSKTYWFVLFFVSFLVFYSCRTSSPVNVGTAVVGASEPSVPETGKLSDPSRTKDSRTKEDYPPPIEVPGTIDFTSPEYNSLWDTSPRNGKMVFFASVPRREHREEEIDFCVKDAARQVSLYYAARVETKQAVKSNNRDLGYVELVKSGFDREVARREIPKIKVLLHYRDTEGSYILAECKDLSSLNIPRISGRSLPPSWVRDVPSISGYLLSVGVVQRSMLLSDSLKKADDQALANLSRQISINVKSKRTDIEVKGGSAYSQTHYEVSSTILKGFYVLGRWSEDHGNTFYTLAICKQGIGE